MYLGCLLGCGDSGDATDATACDRVFPLRRDAWGGGGQAFQRGIADAPQA